MISFLLLFFIISYVDANTCSCLLGYRNGAQSTDQNLCMGPAEGGERPCYPTPCNSDWTPCTTVSNDNSCPSWEKVSSHLGKKPDCEKVIVNNGHNYLWGTLEQCKNKCLSESSGKCNIVSRYSGKNDNENYHCRFYGCKDLNNFNWIDQNEWGNGASGCVTYKLGCNLDEDICRTCPWMENTCDPINRYINITQYVNQTRYINVTRYVDIPKYINTSRYVNVTKYFNQTLYINQTRYHDIINYINRTKINNSDITFKIVYKNNNTSPSSPQTAISDHSNNYDRNVNKTDLKKYISLFNLSRTEIILIIIIIILMIHCIFRETYFGKYCNIRCICLRAFSYDKEDNIKYSSNNIHIQLPQREKIEI